jgi:hypothetical protein
LELLARWQPPTNAQDIISVSARWGSSEQDGGRFIPVTTASESRVLSVGLAGLGAFRTNYTIMPMNTLSLLAEATYFVRSNETAFSPQNKSDEAARLLGGELFAQAIWVPVLDVSVIAGGGMFIPALGDVYSTDERVKVLFSLGLLLSL